MPSHSTGTTISVLRRVHPPYGRSWDTGAKSKEWYAPHSFPTTATRSGLPLPTTGMCGARRRTSSEGRGVFNTGIRAEVTGGRHLHALQELVVSVFVDAGIPAGLIDVKRRPIAGYFRRDKSWDVVVMVADRVVGIIELKSMAGGSPGQNYNNRTDEALGQAVDVWTAVEREIVGPQRPWLGYFMLLEDNAAFTTAVKPRRTVWEPDSAFDGGQLRGPVCDLLRADGRRAAAGRGVRGSR